MSKPENISIDLNDPYIRSYVERCRHCDPTVITDDDRKADHDARRREKKQGSEPSEPMEKTARKVE